MYEEHQADRHSAGKIIAFDVNAGGFMCLGQDDHKVEVVQKAAQAEA
jgi:hypothetical protein